jgi:mono/diheme cytochrome c family protein
MRATIVLSAACLLGGGFLAAPAARAADGLVAEYADGQRRVTAVVPTPHFSLKAGESIHPSVRPEFTATFTGTLKVLSPGRYRFDTGGATLAIAGKPVPAAGVDLAAGVHDLRIDYRRTAPDARLQITWSSAEFGPEPLPATLLEHRAAPAGAPRWTEIARGRALVEDLNCRGCHAGGEPQGPHDPGRGPVLTNAGRRLSPAWVYAWLKDPAAYRKNARMPHVPLSDAERLDVTAYLATARVDGYADPGSITEKEASGGDALRAKGKGLFEAIGCKACHGTGPGLVSLEGVGSKMSVAALRAYLLQPGKVDPTGRMPSLALKDDEAAALALYLAQGRSPGFEAPVPAGGDAQRGKALVAGKGCLGCHTVEVETKPLASTLQAPAFAALRGGKGCLAEAPPARAPRYRVTAADRAAIAAYLETPDVARAPLVEATRAMEVFRCRACHEVNAPPLVAWKESPPSLNDTGNKLKTAWIKEVVTGKRRMRHWLELRMPEFAHAGALAEGLAALAGASRGPEPAPARTAAAAGAKEDKPDPLVLREGVRYLGRGEEGLACINCHDYAWYRSGAATPAPDMSTMAQRMRPEWFRRWLMDPARIQPGTQMPAFFVDVDATVVDKKITALWAALSMGKDMPLPEGVTPDNKALKLPVGPRPLVFRSFVTGGGTRSVLVGFPNGPAYSFDAEGCRVEFAWAGEFLDVRAVWLERGGQSAAPLGERWFVAGAGQPLRVADAGKVPTARSRGYTLDAAGVPTFTYELDGHEVRDRITPGAGGVGLERTIEVRPARGKRTVEVWFAPGPTPGVSLSFAGAAWDGTRAYVKADKGAPARFTVTLKPAPAPLNAEAPK